MPNPKEGAAPRTSAQLRRDLVRALALDLVGPGPGHPHALEGLSMAPSRWYLTGFLVPSEAPEEQKTDPTVQEELALGADGGAGDDDETPEPPAVRRAHFPSSMGVSVLVPAAAKSLEVTVDWGDYVVTTAEEASTASAPAGSPAAAEAEAHPKREIWQRRPRQGRVTVSVAPRRQELEVPESRGLRVVVSSRRVSAGRLEPFRVVGMGAPAGFGQADAWIGSWIDAKTGPAPLARRRRRRQTGRVGGVDAAAF